MVSQMNTTLFIVKVAVIDDCTDVVLVYQKYFLMYGGNVIIPSIALIVAYQSMKNYCLVCNPLYSYYVKI